MSRILPRLETPRLLLRPAQPDDLKALQQHWNDPLVRRYLFDDRPVDDGLAAKVLGACLDGAPEGHGLWLITEKTSRRFLGCVALIPTSVAAGYEPLLAGLLEPMVSLDPREWGRGVAAEGLAAVLRYAFECLDVASLAAVNDVPNAASEIMILNAGFSVVSEVDGPRYRLRTYRLQRQRWLERDVAQALAHADRPSLHSTTMKTQYYTATSLDGFISTEDDSLDWLFPLGDINDTGYPNFISQVGALAMGATTYEWILRHSDKVAEETGTAWPYTRPAWVFTHRDLPRVEHADVRFVQGNVADVHPGMIQAAGDKNIWVVGGGDLAGQFHDAGLLDEAIIQVASVTLGKGKPLFPRRVTSPPWQLLSVRQIGPGFAELRYQLPGRRTARTA